MHFNGLRRTAVALPSGESAGRTESAMCGACSPFYDRRDSNRWRTLVANAIRSRNCCGVMPDRLACRPHLLKFAKPIISDGHCPTDPKHCL